MSSEFLVPNCSCNFSVIVKLFEITRLKLMRGLDNANMESYFKR
jgi:hypothetical protein